MSGEMDKGQIIKIAVAVVCLAGAGFFLFKDQIFKPAPPPPPPEREMTPEEEQFEEWLEEEQKDVVPSGA